MGVEEARARFERVAFAQFLGVSVVEVSHERAVLRLPFQEDNAIKAASCTVARQRGHPATRGMGPPS